MTTLLILIVVVLLGIAIWQLTKIFDLTQIGNTGEASDASEIANEKDNNVNGYLMFGFLAFLYIFTIYSIVKWGHFPLLSNAASEHGQTVDNLMIISFVIIFAVQILTQTLLHYFAFKSRGIKDQKAFYFADNDKLEFMWTIIPVIVLAGLILYGLYGWTNIMFVDEEEEVIYVELYAKQFSWEARYAGDDNVLGKANVRLIEGVNTMGVDMTDPNAADDIPVSELHLPVGKRVVFKIRSQDVTHSVYMPHFRAQMNAVPGMVTQFSFIPTVTSEQYRELDANKTANINKLRAEASAELIAKGQSGKDPYNFEYVLLCNKICGASHYNMQMKIVVESEADYKAWLKTQKTLKAAVQENAQSEAPAEVKAELAETATEVPAVAVDSTTVVAQVN
jgi:cytochrome c oxidase subunit II